MIDNIKIMRFCLISLLSLTLMSGCSDNESEWFSTNITNHPSWYGQASYVEVNTDDGISKVWQSKKRCCVKQAQLDLNNREFYKTCVKAINKNISNDRLVVLCLWLMGGAVDTPRRIKIKEYLLDHYFHHQKRTDNCVNCKTGDITARVSKTLAYYYSKTDINKAIDTVEKPLNDGFTDISPWIQVEMLTYLGKLYLKASLTEDRKNWFNTAYKKLSLQRDHETLKRRIGDLDKVHKEINPDQ